VGAAGGTGGAAPIPAASDDEGCSVAFGSKGTHALSVVVGVLAMVLLGRRRRRG
jgi:uncharacterized protein (TIGR03382 family)